ncbi:response regulator [Nocardia vinacea]|uniref:LytR/AlgR family response regulator transcription factor n=1 Tax=Nocardia vinacea TaxID=96468 RepID=UPI002E0FCC0E|nr:response regulator [Nocardia vinacea]
MIGLLDVLVVDDEKPAVDAMVHFLDRDGRIGRIFSATSVNEALRVLQEHHVDAIFLDIHMPSLTGLDLARVLNRFTEPPAVVFVTADDTLAVKAFELKAADYLLKPVSERRLAETVGRLAGSRAPLSPDPQLVTVDQGSFSRMIKLEEVRYAEASGDYVRLFTADSDYLVRIPMSTLAEQWESDGFVRIHRSYLVSLRHVDQVHFQGVTGSVTVGPVRLPVSRRSVPLLRSMLQVNRIRSGR